MSQQYDVFMFQLPQVSADNKSIVGPPSQTKRFDDLERAFAFAEENSNLFNRITIHLVSAEAPTLLGRFDDGKKIVTTPTESDSDAATTTASAHTG
jgi:hypothetical protein